MVNVRRVIARAILSVVFYPVFYFLALCSLFMILPVWLLVEAAQDRSEWSAPFVMLWEFANAPKMLMEDLR